MYEKKRSGWLEHSDFILVDVLCQQMAFLLSYALCCQRRIAYRDGEYLSLAVMFVLVDFCVVFVFETFQKVRSRGYYKEFASAVKHVLLVEGVVLIYLFAVQSGHIYPRAFIYTMIPLYVLLTYSGRLLWKLWLRQRGPRSSGRSLIVISPQERFDECVKNICETNYDTYSFIGAIMTDADCAGEIIQDIPIVENFKNALEYIRREWVDEVFLAVSLEEGYPVEFTDQLKQMGVVVHIPLTKAGSIMENTQQIERMGNYTVLTTGINCATPMQLWVKRMMDVAAGLTGCLITAILFVMFAIPIYSASPGPIFFAQERIGRNGKKFKLYKFRTMVPDAEQRKKDLMEHNRIDGDRMFKLDYDPRIIGNRRLEDGTVKKGLGSFLREFSLDEFPQMFNVLRGDMSLVGTRPPTVDEWESYELHHRARLSFRPGVTGLWQVSGRSDITDFEDVVKLDMKYIDEWTLGLDIKIVLKTIGVMVHRSGAI